MVKVWIAIAAALFAAAWLLLQIPPVVRPFVFVALLGAAALPAAVRATRP